MWVLGVGCGFWVASFGHGNGFYGSPRGVGVANGRWPPGVVVRWGCQCDPVWI